MKLIRPTAELWEQGYTIKDIWKHIARCTRICYQSTPKNENEDDEAFVRRVLFRHQPDNSIANHLAMLEHGTVYLIHIFSGDINEEFKSPLYKYKFNKYSKYISEQDRQMAMLYNHFIYVTTNLRVLVENNWLDDLQYLCEPTKYHERRYTICFTTNLGVSREFNRHRVNSIAEESTRYCNYSKDKFGNEITFVVPEWYTGPVGKVELGTERHVYDENNTEWYLSPQEYFYLNSLFEAGDNYLCLIRMGWVPQQAREVLPLATKTQLVHTAFGKDWSHFIALRSDGVSGAPHPNAKILGDMVAKLLNGKTV